MKKNKIKPEEKPVEKAISKKAGKKHEKVEKIEPTIETFNLGTFIQQSRQKKGLTQEQLATLVKSNKSYVSKLEKNLKDIRFSTLQRIIKKGFGGQIEISIKYID